MRPRFEKFTQKEGFEIWVNVNIIEAVYPRLINSPKHGAYIDLGRADNSIPVVETVDEVMQKIWSTGE